MAKRGWHETVRESRTGATMAVFLLAAVILLFAMDRTFNIFDEGLMLTNAMRTLSGDVIHRDYYSPYGPASTYALAGLFALFGNSFIVARIFGIAIMAGIVAVIFKILVIRTRVRVSLTFTALVGGWLITSPFYLYPLFPCLLFALIGSALVQRSHIRRAGGPLFFAGCCAGVAALFRYDGGFFLLVVHLTSLAILIAIDASSEKWIRRFTRATIVYGCGAALVSLPVAIAYVVSGSLTGFAADIIDYPLNHYSAMRSLPFPGLSAIIREPAQAGIYLPIVAAMLGIFQITRLSRQQSTPDVPTTDPDVVFLVLFTLLTMIFYYKGIVRVSTLHMMMSIIPANLVLALLFDRWWRSGSHLLSAIVLGVSAVPSAFAVKHELRVDFDDPARTVGWSTIARSMASGAMPQTECPVLEPSKFARTSPDYAVITNYLRRSTAPNERIFVGLSRHDKIFVNPVGLYFLAGRLPATHWHQFDPGLQTRSDIQRQIIADLARSHIRWLVRDSSFDEVNEPNQSSRSSGVYFLDEYISSHYHPVLRAGKIEIWMPAGVLAPHIPDNAKCMPRPYESVATP